MSLLPSGIFAIVSSVPEEADFLMDVQFIAEFFFNNNYVAKKLTVHLLLLEIGLKIFDVFLLMKYLITQCVV